MILGGIVPDRGFHEASPVLDIIITRVNKCHLFVTCKTRVMTFYPLLSLS